MLPKDEADRLFDEGLEAITKFHGETFAYKVLERCNVLIDEGGFRSPDLLEKVREELVYAKVDNKFQQAVKAGSNPRTGRPVTYRGHDRIYSEGEGAKLSRVK